ncbi:MAG: hypothetical protein DRR04_15025 [Gammaproteobacteria bacterium]|nr:MAG: hypothetical protein DRR04_15025 [Gammaproteobacteria bacterium]
MTETLSTLHERITELREEGKPWFRVELTVEPTDEQSDDAVALVNSLYNLLYASIEELDESLNKPAESDVSPIILPRSH